MQIPDWSKIQLFTRGCPICEALNSSIMNRVDGPELAYCNKCELWYLPSVPEECDLGKIYTNYWSIFRPQVMDLENATQMQINAQDYGNDARIRRLTALMGNLTGKKLLDIGCGMGQFLLLAKNAGAEVFGHDISKEAVQFVESHFGIKVFDCQIKDIIKTTGTFDIIVMNDVIEHLIYPLQVLSDIRDVLSENGMLLIHTPNGGQAKYRLSEPISWTGFNVDLEHLQYFSACTVAQFSTKLGFIIEHLETFGYPSYTSYNDMPETVQQGIEQKRTYPLRNFFQKAPVFNLIYRVMRAIVHEFHNNTPAITQKDASTGSYHLFFILRKK